MRVQERPATVAEKGLVGLPEATPGGPELVHQPRRGASGRLRAIAADYGSLRLTKYGIMPILILTLIDLVQKFDAGIIGIVGPEIRRDFGVSIVLLGTIGNMIHALLLLAGPGIGFITDRTRRPAMVGASAIASGAFASVSAAAPSFGTFAAIRGVDAFAQQLGNVPTQSLIADFYPIEARGKAHSLYLVALSLAGVITPLSAGYLATHFGWRPPFVVVGLLLALTGVLAMVLLREPVRGYWERKRMGASDDLAAEPDPAPGFSESWRTLMSVRTLRRLAFASPFLALSQGTFGIVYTFYLAEQFHLSPFQRGLVSTPPAIAQLIGLLIGGGMTDALIRRRPGRVLAIQGTITIIAGSMYVVLGAVPPKLWLVVVIPTVLLFFGGLVAPAGRTVYSLVMPARMRGQGLGVLAMFELPALFLAPILLGVANTYGLRTGLVMFAPLYVVVGILVISASGFFELDMRSATALSTAQQDYRRAKAEGRTKLLVCNEVDVHYGTVQVLFGVSTVVDRGEIVALLGTNGAGKSTLLRAVSGIQEASSGAVLLDGRDITHIPPYEIARLGVVLMPGGRGVFPSLSVRENLDVALAASPEGTNLEQIFEFFPVLRERLDQEAGLLSGGEQQMVALAQAFLSKPSLLMIDELSLGLAPAVVAQLLEIVRAIHAQGTTVVLVEQSVNIALTVAQRAIFMEKGEVRFDGPTAELLRRGDIMRAVYLKGSVVALTDRAVRTPGTSSHTILEVSGLTKNFGGRTVVNDVSFTMREGEALGLIGPNGAGKTTIFDLISGFVQPDAGRVVYDGVDITTMTADQRGRLRLVRRFQDAKLFPSLTVFEAICVALERQLEVRNTFVNALQIPAVRKGEQRVRARAARIIDLLELGGYRDKFVSELSTGLRRIVDMACVLAVEPKLLLLDEPSAGIAQAEAESLGPLLRRVRFETGCSLLIIEHDMPLISAVADELLALAQGQTVVRGQPDEVLSHPVVVEAYLGTNIETLKRSGVSH